MHGQTIKHVEKTESIQAGDPKFLYQEFKVPVIYNFRKLDIKNGGNGAPLMPFLDASQLLINIPESYSNWRDQVTLELPLYLLLFPITS